MNIDVWAWAGPNQARRTSYENLFSTFKNTAIKDINLIFEENSEIESIKEAIISKINGQYADIWAIAGSDAYHRGNMANYWNTIKKNGA